MRCLVRYPVFLTLVVLTINLAHAELVVTDPWVRATVARQQATGAFLKLSTPTPAKLVAAYSPIAGATELHDMKMEDGVMKMRAVEAIPLSPDTVVELRPGGFHIMLMALKTSLAAGQRVPLTLVIENEEGKRAEYRIEAEVRPLNHQPAESVMSAPLSR
ncbi:MAG: copper chaperone PCu(A)C [Zoogloeaceae bacterium]|nr:copper chaperone PCu(A)C [Zoogloeaceae bacterium]